MKPNRFHLLETLFSKTYIEGGFSDDLFEGCSPEEVIETIETFTEDRLKFLSFKKTDIGLLIIFVGLVISSIPMFSFSMYTAILALTSGIVGFVMVFSIVSLRCLTILIQREMALYRARSFTFILELYKEVWDAEDPDYFDKKILQAIGTSVTRFDAEILRNANYK